MAKLSKILPQSNSSYLTMFMKVKELENAVNNMPSGLTAAEANTEREHINSAILTLKNYMDRDQNPGDYSFAVITCDNSETCSKIKLLRTALGKIEADQAQQLKIQESSQAQAARISALEKRLAELEQEKKDLDEETYSKKSSSKLNM